MFSMLTEGTIQNILHSTTVNYINNNSKWTFVMRQLQKCPVAQYRHNENIQ